MRHSRSIQLIPDDFNKLDPDVSQNFAEMSFGSLRQWQRLGGKCCDCPHLGWLDKRLLEERFAGTTLIGLQPLLRCTRCDSKGGNKFILGVMARD